MDSSVLPKTRERNNRETSLFVLCEREYLITHQHRIKKHSNTWKYSFFLHWTKLIASNGKELQSAV